MNVVDNEAQLVSEACQGSLPAFEALVQLYEPRIRRLIYGMTQNVQLTEDLCQDAFIAAYRALPRMQDKDLKFAPWLYRIATNQVRSEWRRHKNVKIVPFTTPQLGDDNTFDEQGEDFLVSHEQFEEGVMQRELVRRTLSQLPEASVTCLLMDAEGFSYNEIANATQDTLSAVRSRLSRARQAFQRIYNRLDQEGK